MLTRTRSRRIKDLLQDDSEATLAKIVEGIEQL